MVSQCSTVTHFNMNTSCPVISTHPTNQSEGNGGRDRCGVLVSRGPPLLIQPNVLCFTEQLHCIRSVPPCVFAHIYYSLCSQITWLCYILNIKHAAIRRDVFDPGRNTLSLQTSFESKYTQLNDIHCSKHGYLSSC